MGTIFYINEDTLTVMLSGEIDHHVAEKIRNDIDDEIRFYKAHNLIFDFSDVAFMDSSGVGMVLGRYKRINALGGTVLIRNCNRLIRQIMDMSGVFSLMEYEENVKQGGSNGK